MPRTVVSTAPTVVDFPTASVSLTALGAGTAVDPTNGHEFTAAALPVARRVLIMINNTFAGSKTVTLKAPVYTPGQLAGGPNHRGSLGGDLVLTCAQSTSVNLFTVELGRYLQPVTGSLFVDYAAAMTGNIRIMAMPDGV